MTVTEQTRGQCRMCGRSFTKPGMARHVRTCRGRPDGRGASGGLLLALEDREAPSYWLVVESSPTATWDDLDRFLRQIWVECCGHLSCFDHAGTTFAYDREGAEAWAADPRSMGERIVDSVGAGSRFSYEYDFGTTTELAGRVLALVPGVLALVPGVPAGDPIGVVARNEPPVRTCAACGRGATTVCSLCFYDRDAPSWCCDACSEHHCCVDSGIDSDSDYFLPVVNSPRVGLCGYRGPAEG